MGCCVSWPIILQHDFLCPFFLIVNEHGYSEPISSGREFQFFGAHLTSKSRMDMRVGAFDRYTLPICGKNTELVCRTSQFFFWDAKVENFFLTSEMSGICHSGVSKIYKIFNFGVPEKTLRGPAY